MRIELYGHGQADDVRTRLLDVHDEVYAGSTNPFDTRDRFANFLDAWSAKPEWACVIGFDQDEPVGFAYGAPFDPGRWWSGQSLPAEMGASAQAFGLSELMVRTRWRKTGASNDLHTALLEGRPEQHVTLLVDTAHLKVKRLYEAWGYRQLGEQQPFDDSPLFAMMVRDLREPVSGD